MSERRTDDRRGYTHNKRDRFRFSPNFSKSLREQRRHRTLYRSNIDTLYQFRCKYRRASYAYTVLWLDSSVTWCSGVKYRNVIFLRDGRRVGIFKDNLDEKYKKKKINNKSYIRTWIERALECTSITVVMFRYLWSGG